MEIVLLVLLGLLIWFYRYIDKKSRRWPPGGLL